jgi:hypothetical protein
MNIGLFAVHESGTRAWVLATLVRVHSACYIDSQRRFDDLLAGAFINAAKTDLSTAFPHDGRRWLTGQEIGR